MCDCVRHDGHTLVLVKVIPQDNLPCELQANIVAYVDIVCSKAGRLHRIVAQR